MMKALNAFLAITILTCGMAQAQGSDETYAEKLGWPKGSKLP